MAVGPGPMPSPVGTQCWRSPSPLGTSIFIFGALNSPPSKEQNLGAPLWLQGQGWKVLLQKTLEQKCPARWWWLTALSHSEAGLQWALGSQSHALVSVFMRGQQDRRASSFMVSVIQLKGTLCQRWALVLAI